MGAKRQVNRFLRFVVLWKDWKERPLPRFPRIVANEFGDDDKCIGLFDISESRPCASEIARASFSFFWTFVQ